MKPKPTVPNEKKIVAYINRLRGYLGLGPINKLPKGRLEDAIACPIANGIQHGIEDCNVDVAYGEIRVSINRVSITNSARRNRISTTHSFKLVAETPQYINRFINNFDEGKYPHLQAA